MEKIRVLHLPSIRVSSSAFARVWSPDNRLLLLLNTHHPRPDGKYNYSPLGGGIEVRDEGALSLQRLLDIRPEDFEKGADLRFRSQGSKTNLYREWFLRRVERETDPRREIDEELREETGLLNDADLAHQDIAFRGYVSYVRETLREGKAGQLSLYLCEVHDLRLRSQAMDKLLSRAGAPSASPPPALFASIDEIRRLETSQGYGIADISDTILSPQPTIDPFI